MTTFTTSGITFPQPATTITLQYESRSVTITAREYIELRDLFDLFEAAIISVGFVQGSYRDMLCELAAEIESADERALEAERRRMAAEQNNDEDDETDDCA